MTNPGPDKVSDTRPDSRLRTVGAPLALLFGDTLASFLGLTAGFYLRYHTPLERFGLEVPDARYRDYLPLILVGVALLVAAFAQLQLYDSRNLLRRYMAFGRMLKALTFWLFVYLGVSLALKFDPPISRLFVVIAWVTTAVALHLWRSLFDFWARRPKIRARLRQRTVLLGWNSEAGTLVREVRSHDAHPFVLAGVVAETAPADNSIEWLGKPTELESLLREAHADVLVVCRSDIPRAELVEIARICERTYVDWKLVPSVFPVFVSGLRLQAIGGLPILGVEDLAVSRLFNRILKRTFDIAGAVCGLALGIPVMAVLAVLIRRESPGPVLFRQNRIGTGHREFTLHKLRSMRHGADEEDHLHPSTVSGDDRLLRIGAFMRRWNLDELPQFWNVLRGDMSLVGPRPERPYHVNRHSENVDHYLPRHLVKPGMTGWAQVNGFRGDTSIEQRIQHDIYYIENWSLWLDLQIILLTFVRWKAPA